MVYLFESFGNKFLLDVNSETVHLADDIIFEICTFINKSGSFLTKNLNENLISLFPTFGKENVEEAYFELYELFKQGLIYSEEPPKIELPQNIKGSEQPVKALCLHVSHDCNLRCEYCFAGKGSYGGECETMSIETAKKAIDFVILRSGARRNIEIDFFGGEPLMAWETVVETVKYARLSEKENNKEFRFTLTTNGLLLDDEKIEFTNNEMSNIVLSLDGRKETNDLYRRTANGKSSYDTVLKNFKKLVSKRKNDYYVRGTFTPQNLDFCADIMHLYNLGFENISLEPVIVPKGSPLEIKQEHLPKIFNEYDKLAKKISEIKKADKHITFFHFMLDIDHSPCLIKRVKGCGAGSEYAAVTPGGDIYPCHQMAGNKEYLLGNVNTGKFNSDNAFAKTNLYTRKSCADCFAKYYCSGGCSAANININNEINMPYQIGCELIRKRLETAIALSVVLQAEEEIC